MMSVHSSQHNQAIDSYFLITYRKLRLQKRHEEITVLHLLHYCVLCAMQSRAIYNVAAAQKIDSWIYVCTRYNEYLHFGCTARYTPLSLGAREQREETTGRAADCKMANEKKSN